MFGRRLAAAASLALASCSTSTASEVSGAAAYLPADQQAFLDACEPWDDWDKPAPPFRIYGGTYYVGTCGIASILITGDEGHTLLDTGTDEGAKVVLLNIGALGLNPTDVKTIKLSHEHHDHVGGIARVQDATGAIVVSSELAAETLHTGLPSATDPQAVSGHPPFLPLDSHVVLVFAEPAAVVGPKKIRPIFTPGHTPGALSWQWEECESNRCRWIVYADSLSPVSSDEYRFSDHPEYVAEYRAGLNRLAALPCDILLAPHPSHAQLFKHLESGSLLAMEAPCPAYAAKKHADLDKRLAKEAAPQPSAGE